MHQRYSERCHHLADTTKGFQLPIRLTCIAPCIPRVFSHLCASLSVLKTKRNALSLKGGKKIELTRVHATVFGRPV